MNTLDAIPASLGVDLADVDEIAIERALTGDLPRPHLTPAERTAAIWIMHQRGDTPTRIAECTNMSRLTVQARIAAWAGRTPAARRPVQCGTRSGYQRHKRKHEAACDGCKAANAADDHVYRLTGSYPKAS